MNLFRRTAIVLTIALLAPTLVACSTVLAEEFIATDSSSLSTSTIPYAPITISTATVTSATYEGESPENTQSTVGQTTSSPLTNSPSTTVTEPETTEPETTEPETTEPETTEPETTEPETTEPETTEPETMVPPTVDEPDIWDEDRTVLQYDDFKAMWVSQYDLYNIYTNNGVQRGQTDFTKRIQEALDNITGLGFNTIILQVRPNADSMYPSDIYPMCQYVVGKYGREAEYDPVAILVEEAHKRSISIHAWINPLRAMTDDEILLVDSQYKIRQWHDDPEKNGTYLVLYKGRYYLNPAYEEARALIVSGAKEALTRYDFDGLHMDDYFYPTTATSFDATAYEAYTKAGGTMNLGDFRREQINLLVAELYAATKSIHPDLRYGISPAGNYDYSYANQYADFYTWCGNEGYIDYICPQIYYGLEHQIYPFGGICDIFSDMIKVDSVDLIIGMAFGKAESQTDKWAGTGANEWKDNKDVMKRSLEYTADLEHCTGIAVFCYQYFYHPLTGVLEEDIAEERDNFLPVLKDITWQTVIE